MNMEKILVNTNKYDGQYVALMSADDNTIVGAGNTPQEALNDARKKGIKHPFILYISDKDLVHIYDIG